MQAGLGKREKQTLGGRGPIVGVARDDSSGLHGRGSEPRQPRLATSARRWCTSRVQKRCKAVYRCARRGPVLRYCRGAIGGSAECNDTVNHVPSPPSARCLAAVQGWHVGGPTLREASRALNVVHSIQPRQLTSRCSCNCRCRLPSSLEVSLQSCERCHFCPVST